MIDRNKGLDTDSQTYRESVCLEMEVSRVEGQEGRAMEVELRLREIRPGCLKRVEERNYDKERLYGSRNKKRRNKKRKNE